MKKIELTLKDGSKVIGDTFDNDDFITLKSIFKKWQDINIDLKSLEGRTLNVPDVFSEALYCIFFNAARTNGTAHSYDCVDIETGAGIQIKSASISHDCTSFGPRSTWDELWFVDFAPNGTVDGIVDFYHITNDIYSIILNNAKHETFKMQQEQGRRPRFSIKSFIIEPNKLKPVKRISLVD